MDQNTLIAIIAVLIVFIIGIALYRKFTGEVKAGPFSARVEGSNAEDQPAAQTPPPGTTAKDLKSTGGGVTVSEQAGGSVDVERVEAKKDINVTRTDGNPPPKA